MNYTLIRFSRTTSTQDWVKAWAELGTPEGLVVQAHEQTVGRGRLQREWWSPYGTGLYLSVLLRPSISLLQAGLLPMLVSLAAIHACEEIAGIMPRPKWPNDLLFDGRKLAGVLAELDHHDDQLDYAVIGLGLNVNMDFSNTDLQHSAVSLKEASGQSIDIDALRDAYLAQLKTFYQRFLTGKSPREEWRQHLEPLGRQVRVVRAGHSELSGKAIDISADGALLVQDRTGIVHEIWAGDIIPIHTK